MWKRRLTKNRQLLRLKNSIDPKVLTGLNKTLLLQNLFIPISLQKGDLYVAISHSSDRDLVCNILKRNFTQPIKFVLVTEDDLKELISLIFGGSQ